MLVCVFSRAICTRDRGCSAHPAFPAPSDRRARKISSKPRAHAPRDREVMFVTNPRLSSPAKAGDAVFQRQQRFRADSAAAFWIPACAGMTIVLGATLAAHPFTVLGRDPLPPNRPGSIAALRGTPPLQGRWLGGRHDGRRNSSRRTQGTQLSGEFSHWSVSMDLQLTQRHSALHPDASSSAPRQAAAIASSKPIFLPASTVCPGAAFTPASCWRSGSPGSWTGWRSRWPARCRVR